MAQQHRRRPAAAVGPRQARVSSSTTATSTASTTSTPTCRRRRPISPASTTGRATRANRINNTAPNVITSAIVMKNQDVGRRTTSRRRLAQASYNGLSVKGAYSYGMRKNTIDPGSTAFASWANNQHAGDPNNPGRALQRGAGTSRLRADDVHRVVLRLRRNDHRGVLGGEAVRAELQQQRQLRVRAAT